MTNFHFSLNDLRVLTPELETSLTEITRTVGQFITHAVALSETGKAIDLAVFAAKNNQPLQDVTADVKFYELNLWRERFVATDKLNPIDPQRVEAGKKLLSASLQIAPLLDKTNKMQDQFSAYTSQAGKSWRTFSIGLQQTALRQSASHLEENVEWLQNRLTVMNTEEATNSATLTL